MLIRGSEICVKFSYWHRSQLATLSSQSRFLYTPKHF